MTSSSGVGSSCLALLNGVNLPRVGLGTFRAKGNAVGEAVKWAWEAGIRHFDTASIYKNEEDIALAMQTVGIPRQSVFITSKISPYELGTDKTRAACEGVLERLATDYVDLVLIHWPGTAGKKLNSVQNSIKRMETWKVLEEYYREGRFRAIGVSNYEVSHILELLNESGTPPMVNQIEIHPFYQNDAVRRVCLENGIAVVAYASLGVGNLLKEERIQTIARRNEKTEAQVLLQWALQQGLAVIPKSVHKDYIEGFAPSNFEGWELSTSDMQELSEMDCSHRFCWDPSGVI
ncbi:hypothetical protein BSKO_14024 [Bryopsis sp. KO-2023]|nr:hypothetical protein BSKO_14024 [Bryopsis sp. KO-2023]